MADETKRLIQVRSEKSASFKRDGAGKKKQLSESWRMPRGLHSKKRRQKKAKGPLPTPGYGSPIEVRGMHPSGYREVRVFTPGDLAGLNPEEDAVRIGGTVGNKKRLLIQDQAVAAGLKVLNARDIRPKEQEEKSDD
ncbi:MAG TPA: 50S ribosomal protein L32e [Methanoregulaceae archaeon]|nr:MAG: 50S ribosomal protein L32e [Euryarchaeota archaeon ADurb.BinA087]HPH34024.1 50S ribosomal protein L32e [Methanoregulaceae archaeon]HPX72963.1 50S ribosomal protein L32e [Methanoregulaceae archaeon]HQA81447.1 50S ribosomal protein L32e [Methanoregulaceae archaeon]